MGVGGAGGGAGTRKERVEGRKKGSEAEGKVAVDEGLWERGRETREGAMCWIWERVSERGARKLGAEIGNELR